MEDNNLEKKIDERIKKIVPQILEGSAFTDRKLTDTPTDKNSVVPRGYVTMNGSVASRPINSVIGQFYFDSTNNQAMWRGSTGRFYDGIGSIIA